MKDAPDHCVWQNARGMRSLRSGLCLQLRLHMLQLHRTRLLTLNGGAAAKSAVNTADFWLYLSEVEKQHPYPCRVCVVHLSQSNVACRHHLWGHQSIKQCFAPAAPAPAPAPAQNDSSSSGRCHCNSTGAAPHTHITSLNVIISSCAALCAAAAGACSRRPSASICQSTSCRRRRPRQRQHSARVCFNSARAQGCTAHTR